MANPKAGFKITKGRLYSFDDGSDSKYKINKDTLFLYHDSFNLYKWIIVNVNDDSLILKYLGDSTVYRYWRDHDESKYNWVH